MKTTLIALLLICNISFAQKTQKFNCERLKFNEPPLSLAIQEYNTYAVDVVNLSGFKLTKETSVYLPGLRRASSTAEAEIIIKIIVHPFEVSPAELVTTNTEKEVDGVTKTITTYKLKSTCNLMTEVYLLKQDESEFYSDEFGHPGKFESRAMGSKANAQKEYDNAKEKYLKDNVESYVGEGMKAVTAKYCYRPRTKKFEVITIKPKKFDYDEINKSAELMKKAVSLYSAGERPTEESNKLCLEAIGNWEKDLLETDPENKKSRINRDVTAALHYNVGMALYLMEDYEGSRKRLQEAMDIEPNVTALHASWIHQANLMIDRKVNRKK